MYGRLAGRRLPFLYKAPEEGLKVSALCGGRNGLYLEGSICGIPCLMLVDTGANVTLVRTDLTQKLKQNFIYTAPGYWKVEIQPEDKEKTAFTTRQGRWQFKVMLFGLCNAPATFERLMETVLRGLRIKQALITSTVFTCPRNDKKFILDTDASNKGIGVVLSQKIGNEECVIDYFSKSLGKPEINYCVTRKELLAIVKSIQNFHHYLYGRKFLLPTDHASLRCLFYFREPEGQIARWIQTLQEYDFEIQHRKRTSHGNADALSRRPCKESYKHSTNAQKKFGMETDISMRVLTTEDAWSSSEIQKAQIEDPAIWPILEKKLNSEDPPSWQEIAPESPATKRYWALGTPYTLRMVFYIVSGRVTMEAVVAGNLFS
ncbi:Retrovirus-related Pol polyprotein from transposon 297 [Araneus ventricosus]|uniref:Retrovirus-related Pol polyprotein from transposon 297 n=1 Tax=Araneus ventricosus TaxID=182803 RepID=A0A4Y2MMZ7_ARAVE|nr:Retrovirus-related Pol polyprotein from transposon 297 [Araneus ventricosus]